MSYPKLVVRAALAMVAGLGIAGSSWAGSAGVSLNVTATVTSNCTITAPSGVTFGAYDPLATADKTGSGQVSVTCTKGATGVTVGVSYGTNAGAVSGTQRFMLGATGGDPLNYNLFQPTGIGGSTGTSAQVFDSGTTTPGAFAIPASSFTGGKATVLMNVWGVIPKNQDVTGTFLGNSYTDQVVATVTY